MLIILLVFTLVGARAPGCAVLFLGNGSSCDGRLATLWVEAAQDEAVRFYHTENGGFLQPACTGARGTQQVPPYPVPQEAILCVDKWDIPKEKCATKRCNFTAHHELFHSDCDDERDHSVPKHGRSDDDDDDDDNDKKEAACRSIRSWARIGSAKIQVALDELEQQHFDNATSAACAADFIFSHINKWLLESQANAEEKLVFINERARRVQHYVHINSALARATFADADLEFGLRIIQSVRECGSPRHEVGESDGGARRVFSQTALLPGQALLANDSAFGFGLGSVLIYSTFNGTGQTVPTITQLDFAPTGTLTGFASRFGPFNPTAYCVTSDADTNLAPFDLARRFPPTSPSDTAAVRDNGEPRYTNSFLPTGGCPVVVLLQDLHTNKSAGSVMQMQLRTYPTPVQPDAFAKEVEAGIVLGQISPTDCTDSTGVYTQFFLNSTSGGNSTGNGTLRFAGTDFRSPPVGVPLTLAPGESRCVGGDNAGKPCSAKSECGAGYACRRKPLSPHNVAYCYDGAWWDERRPCAFADVDDQCPFGECFGEANDVAGGAYPLLYFYQQNQCNLAGAASAVCAEAHVASWHQYPNEAAFA